MRRDILGGLHCPACKNASFCLEDIKEDDIEIREANVVCVNCRASHSVRDGILDFLKSPSPDVKKEQDAVDMEAYLRDDKGDAYKINKESIAKFRKQFLLLPEGDGSSFFKRGGCFQPIAEASGRFYDTLKLMQLKGGERVLSLGDGFGYASYKFAQAGCSAMALDISKYLLAADLYIKNAYFDRIFSDMHDMPFKDGIFDIVFCSAVLHHSKDLKKVFSGIRRILKQGGRLFVLNESSRGVFENADSHFEELKKRGYSDTAYTIPEWLGAVSGAGFGNFKIEFLSLADDYVKRQENKGPDSNMALRFARFLCKHRGIEKTLSFLLKYPRVLFRPKSWRMVCYK